MDGIGFGAAYYTEYQRRPDIETDFSLMAKAGFSVIRVGESVWSSWEPQDGRFELDWLEPVLDAALRYDIKVILGTPTYAVPMWLTRRYPEIAAETVTGHRIGWGARQEVNFAHAAYRFHAERVIRQVIGRYRDHPAITGYQVDNEPGLRLLYNADVFEKFVDWLRRRYGTVSQLNQEWGLAYWSHLLSQWSDLWRPEGNFQPQYDLAWRRFQAELVTEFIGWQAGIVRELTGGRGFVTTCISYEQPGIEDAELSRALDVASGNAYCEMQDSLAHPSALPRSAGPMGWVVRGPWAVTQLADLMYSSKQAPFLITETNAGSIGFSAMNESPYDGQWRQLAWLLVARGARLIEYWHWNTLPFGAETYWGGVLPHSGIPGRAYREIARTGQELREAGGAFGTAEPDYDIAVLYDSDSKFALSTQGPLRGDVLADPDSYRHIVAAFSRGIFDAKRQQRLVRPQQLLPSRGGGHDAAHAATRYPVLIAAAFYTAADEDLDFLVDYARAGGHLVVGPRTGYADPEGRARTERAPGPDHRRGRRLVRRDGFAAVTGAGRRLAAGRGDGIRRRARRLGSGGPRCLSASAPQPLGRRHHNGRRGGPHHCRRHHPGSEPGGRPGAVAGAPGRGRVDHRRLGHRLHLHRRYRHPAACPAQLELGGGGGFAILDADRRPWRRAARARRAGRARALGRPALPRR